jgi:hypothetical protein
MRPKIIIEAVLRIRDVYPKYDFYPPRIPDPKSRVKNIPDPGPRIRIRIKEFKYLFLTLKIVSKLSEILSGIFIPDPDLDFLPIPDPRSRIQGSKKHRIPDSVPQNCLEGISLKHIDEEVGCHQGLRKRTGCKNRLVLCGFDLARVFESRKMCTDAKIGYKNVGTSK